METSPQKRRFCPSRGLLGSAEGAVEPAVERSARRFGRLARIAAFIWLGFLSLAVLFAPPWLAVLGVVLALDSVGGLWVAWRGVKTAGRDTEIGFAVGM